MGQILSEIKEPLAAGWIIDRESACISFGAYRGYNYSLNLFMKKGTYK